jgi:type II restriction/modification system DNA methylase subunit YeeA
VYRELVLASCRSYHQLLPELFEGLDDASELLLPDDLLSEGSIAGGFRSAISDADCEDVEIIGWLYQFYISEKKDQVIGKVVKSEDIPAATQLFTPNWIVKYMVQNSLGATWLATYPDSPLKGQMEFYIEPAEQTPEVQAQLAEITPESLDPEALTLIDPACGSGHILVEAYDLLKTIYLERGYRQRDIPELILTKNLYGLDICPRAAQLAAFSLFMKGREDDRRLLERSIQLNVIALQDSTDLNVEHLAASVDLSAAGVSRADVRMLSELFAHATTLGSLIQVPPKVGESLPALSRVAEQMSQDLIISKDLKRLAVLARQAKILARQYDAVVANPPYMGSKGMNALLKGFSANHFPKSKTDLFAVSGERFANLASPAGFVGFMTPFTWMFLKSYEDYRLLFLKAKTLCSLVQPEYHAFFESAYVPVCTFVARNLHIAGYRAEFIKLSEFYGSELQPLKTLEAIRDQYCNWRYSVKPDTFEKLPGSPLSFWLNPRILKAFSSQQLLGNLLPVRGGMTTADNESFLRLWFEVGISRFSILSSDVSGKWFPYNKGGGYRKWYGNREWVVDWEDKGSRVKATGRASVRSEELYLTEMIGWTDVTSFPQLGVRHYGAGFIFDASGPALFPSRKIKSIHVLGFLASKFASLILQAMNPTLHVQAGNVASLPWVPLRMDQSQELEQLVEVLLKISINDWDAYERSWDFLSMPLLSGIVNPSLSLESKYTEWISSNKKVILEMKKLEEENNRLFIDAYGLQDELTPDVPTEQITLTVNPSYRYGGNLSEAAQWERFRRDTMAEFLSYATGCMMGRYSLDRPGLILADSRASQAEQLAAYEEKVGKPLSEVQFKPDPDGIIPVLDGEWFEDDIVARTREFLSVTFPESSVAENLRFIEESLGKDIRKYFCSEFYKDHLQTYKKRPIYWMVQSPAGPSRGGFACLIYLHRYTKDTLNQVLNNYFRPYLQKLEARLAQLGLDQLNDDLPTRERTAARKEAEKITKVLKECQAWEQDALLPLAQQRIELDLDDGVKVNYLKLQDVLAPIPGLAAKED